MEKNIYDVSDDKEADLKFRVYGLQLKDILHDDSYVAHCLSKECRLDCYYDLAVKGLCQIY